MLLLRKLIPAIALIASMNMQAQEFKYKAGYFGFFDNREYFNQLVNDQTIFGSRIYGELGYSFDANNQIMAGADYLYEFGSKGEWIAPDFIAYYHGRYKKLGLFIGAFPRTNKYSMPLALLSDTFQYYRPNIEGIQISFSSDDFKHDIWIDWTGRQSLKKQESFLLGFSGYLKKGVFIYEHHFIMSHLAHSLNLGIEEHIRDNAGFSILPGLDLSRITGLDSLTIHAGLLASYDRLRNVYGFTFPVGFYGMVMAEYRRFGLQGTIYSGDEQIITSGDGFYKSEFYGRADAFYLLSNNHMDGRIQLSMHFLPHMIDLSMSLMIRARIDGAFGRHHSN